MASMPYIGTGVAIVVCDLCSDHDTCTDHILQVLQYVFIYNQGEVIDDGHILKCATKRPFPKLNIIHNNIEYTTRVYKNIRKGMQTILIPGPRVFYLLCISIILFSDVLIIGINNVQLRKIP